MLAPVAADPAASGVAADLGTVVAGAVAAASCFAALPRGFASASGDFMAGASCASCFAAGAWGFTASLCGFASPAGASGFWAGPSGDTDFFFPPAPLRSPFPAASSLPGDASASGCCAIAVPASASEQLMSSVVNLIISMCWSLNPCAVFNRPSRPCPRSAHGSPNEISCTLGHTVPSAGR